MNMAVSTAAGTPPSTRQRSQRVFDEQWIAQLVVEKRERFSDAASGSILRLEATPNRKRFCIYVTDPATGKQRWFYLGDFPTDIRYVGEARELAKSKRNEVRQGAQIAKREPAPVVSIDGCWLPRISEASEQHMARKKLAPATIVAYKQHALLLLDVFGDVSVDSIKRAGLKRLADERGTHRAVYQAFRYHATLWNQGHAALLDSVDEPGPELEAACGRRWPGVGLSIDWDDSNPAAFRDYADFAMFWQVAVEWSVPEVSVMTRVQALMGCRVDELKRLRWEDVELDAKPARVTFRDTKTEDSATFPLPAAACDLLRLMGPRESGWVFNGRAGSHIKKAERIWDAVEEALGYRVNTHALRRFYIAIAAEQRVDPGLARLLTGHVSGGTDAHGGIYLHGKVVPLDTLAKAAEPIAPRLIEIAETGE